MDDFFNTYVDELSNRVKRQAEGARAAGRAAALGRWEGEGTRQALTHSA